MCAATCAGDLPQKTPVFSQDLHGAAPPRGSNDRKTNYVKSLIYPETISRREPQTFASAVSLQRTKVRERLFSYRTYRIGSENAFRIGPQIRELELQGHKVIKCNLGEPDFPLAKHIADEIKRQIDLDLTHYCDPQGILPLREAIASIVSRTRRIDISPDCVVVFPGGQAADRSH